MPWMSINEWKRKNNIGNSTRLKKEEKPKKKASKPVFKLLRFEASSDEWSSLGEFPNEKTARAAGVKQLEDIVIRRSGQDKLFIEDPNGDRHRVIG